MNRYSLVLILIGTLLFSACNQGIPAPTQPSPPQPSPSPSPFISSTPRCVPNEVIIQLRNTIPYEDAVISYNTLETTRNLTIWFVEPDLNAEVEEEKVKGVTEIAVRRSAELIYQLNLSNECISTLFNTVTMIAVDRNYNAWYIGAVTPSNLPTSPNLSDLDWVEVEGYFDDGYRRNQAVQIVNKSAPEDACSWRLAQRNLEAHFSADRVNVSFYYYVDQAGGTIWAQWDVPPWAMNSDDILDGFLRPLPWIDIAVTCLHPPFKTLWVTYVLDDGTVELIGALDGDVVRDENSQLMVEKMEIIFPRIEPQ